MIIGFQVIHCFTENIDLNLILKSVSIMDIFTIYIVNMLQ